MTIQQTPILKLPYPQSTDTADVPRDIQALALAMDPLGVVPIGAVVLWIAVAVPGGWLLLDGQAVAAATYPVLASMFGQSAGNVTLPDMRDRFPVGISATQAANSVGGAASVALATTHMPAHSHGGKTGLRDRTQAHTHALSGSVPSQPGQSGAAGTQYVVGAATLNATNSTDAPDHMHTITSEGGGTAHENRPPFRAVNFIIRAG